MLKELHIAIISPNNERARMIETSLNKAGVYKPHTINALCGLVRTIEELNPDIILIDLEGNAKNNFEQVLAALNANARPIAMFVDHSDQNMAQAAIEAGISAYVVDGLKADRIPAIVETAIARFNKLERVQKELNATKAALDERKAIDRAKGLLMSARGLSEDEAYALMRKTAMDQGRRLSDVAKSLVSAAALLK